MTHLQFVLFAYAVSAAGIGGLIIWLLLSRHYLARRLRQMESREETRQE